MEKVIEFEYVFCIMPKHVCLQIVLLRSITLVLYGTPEFIGCPLAIMQSSLPLWLFERSGPMTLYGFWIR
jgi:hypothetical protein